MHDLALWNTCLVLKLLWNLNAKKDTLWLESIHMFQLKQKSLWAVSVLANCSLVWRKLPKTRHLALPLAKKVIRNRTNTQFFGMIDGIQ